MKVGLHLRNDTKKTHTSFFLFLHKSHIEVNLTSFIRPTAPGDPLLAWPIKQIVCPDWSSRGQGFGSLRPNIFMNGTWDSFIGRQVRMRWNFCYGFGRERGVAIERVTPYRACYDTAWLTRHTGQLLDHTWTAFCGFPLLKRLKRNVVFVRENNP